MASIYYAHSMHIYNTEQELRDVTLLENLGFDVVNPNTQDHKAKVLEIQSQHRESRTDPGGAIMDYFKAVVAHCDAFSFRSLFDGRIPAGVWKELQCAKESSLPIIELPHILDARALSVEDTRTILAYNGQR